MNTILSTSCASNFLAKAKCKTPVRKGCCGPKDKHSKHGNLLTLSFSQQVPPPLWSYCCCCSFIWFLFLFILDFFFIFETVLRHPDLNSVVHMIFSKAVKSTFCFFILFVQFLQSSNFHTVNHLRNKTSNACHISKDFDLVMIDN